MEQLSGTAPEHICNLFRQNCSGFVKMVNSRGIYLQLGFKVVLLCHSAFGTVPNGVALEQWDRLSSLIAPDQPVESEAGVLHFPSTVWDMQLRKVPRDTQIHFHREDQLSAGMHLLLANTKPTGLSALAYPLFAGQTPRMNVYCDMALPHVSALLKALKEENLYGIRQPVSALLGLGPGLTPSGDDLLSGLLYGLRHGPARGTTICEALSDTIRELAGEQTNAVSADYLSAIADDAPFDRMSAAWVNPATGAAELMQIGNNSGGEMLLGLLCAGSIQLRQPQL